MAEPLYDPFLQKNQGQGSGRVTYDTYSMYASYPPRHNQLAAIPAWELTEHQLLNLQEKYLIARDYGPEEMKQKIKELMFPIVEHVLNGNHEGFSFDIHSNEEELLVYLDDLCFPLLKRGKTVNRDFYSRTSTHTAAKTTWALKIIYENLDSGFVGTLRAVFYRRTLLFRNQEASDRTVRDLCYIFGCSRRSLNVTAEEKGWVCGNMKLKLKDGTTTDCFHKTLVTDDYQTEDVIFEQEMKYIVVAEKSTILNYLEGFSFHDVQKCIIITANGFPDINTRRFLRWLVMKTNLPVVGIADPDPSGLEIMRCYAQGSGNLALENLSLAVPNLRWAGFSLTDIKNKGIVLTSHNSKALDTKDFDKLDSLRSHKYTKLGPKWLQAINQMKVDGRKASFEVLYEKGSRYAVDVFLPEMINRALGIQAVDQ